jgi:hypothetical protein
MNNVRTIELVSFVMSLPFKKSLKMFGLSRHTCNSNFLFPHNSVDDTRFTDVRITGLSTAGVLGNTFPSLSNQASSLTVKKQ